MLKENNKHNKNNIPINPFTPHYPAPPNYFVNRTTHLERFTKTMESCAKIATPTPINFIILGDWGMGKTSLLNKMYFLASSDQYKNKIFSFYLSLTPDCCETWEKFSTIFLTQLKRESDKWKGFKDKLRSELKNWKFEFNLVGISLGREGDEDKKLVISLVDSLETYWNSYLKPSGAEMGIFFLDDILYFLRGKTPDAYFTLRNDFQELVRKGCNYALVVTGPELLVKNADIAEPFVRFFEQLRLEPFDLKGTEELITQRIVANNLNLRLSGETISAIHMKSGGHPYFVVFIMFELFNLIGSLKEIEKEDFDSHWPAIFKSMENSVFSNRLREVSGMELTTLRMIAEQKEQLVSPSMVNVKGVNEFFKRLEGKGLLLKRERGQYELFHPLFKDFLKESDSI